MDSAARVRLRDDRLALYRGYFIEREVFSMGKFVIKEAKTGFKFDLKAGNGEIIASSQVYKSLSLMQVQTAKLRHRPLHGQTARQDRHWNIQIAGLKIHALI